MKKNVILIICAMLSACIGTDYRNQTYSSASLIAQNSSAADWMSSQLMRREQSAQETIKPILMATVVDMNDLDQTSAFGRLVTEQVSARFTQLNYNLVEMKLGKAVVVRDNEGEFVLTRELKEIINAVDAKAVVVGTYAENNNEVYINLKVLDPRNSVALAAHSYAIPKASNISEMLTNEIELNE